MWPGETGIRIAADGQADSALLVYERLVSTPISDLDVSDIRYVGIREVRGLPDAYKQLGELYEARSDTTEAVNAYNDFVELWKDADSELQPQVEDVRRRIVNLVGEPSGTGSVN